MSNYNDKNFDQSQDMNHVMSGEAGQEFVFEEEKKPINRNMIVLVVIAAVGASLIYLMYLRGRFNADLQTPEEATASATVSDFMAGSSDSIKKMEEQLAKTEKAVAAFQQDSSAGQVPVNELRTNPFAISETGEKKTVDATPTPTIDPLDDVRRAASKAKLQMIFYMPQGSTATINNIACKVGDNVTVESVTFKVKAITAQSVVLTHGGSEFTLQADSGSKM